MIVASVEKIGFVDSKDFGESVSKYLPVARMLLSAMNSCILQVSEVQIDFVSGVNSRSCLTFPGRADRAGPLLADSLTMPAATLRRLR